MKSYLLLILLAQSARADIGGPPPSPPCGGDGADYECATVAEKLVGELAFSSLGIDPTSYFAHVRTIKRLPNDRYGYRVLLEKSDNTPFDPNRPAIARYDVLVRGSFDTASCRASCVVESVKFHNNR